MYVLLKGLLYFNEHLNMKTAYCNYCAPLHLAESCQRHFNIYFLLFRESKTVVQLIILKVLFILKHRFVVSVALDQLHFGHQSILPFCLFLFCLPVLFSSRCVEGIIVSDGWWEAVCTCVLTWVCYMSTRWLAGMLLWALE